MAVKNFENHSKAFKIIEKDFGCYLICPTADLSFVRIGTRWCRRDWLKTFFVFGDSYSTLQKECGFNDTWVDILACFKDFKGCIRSYASRGATARDDLVSQVDRFFVEYCEKSSSTTETLYVLYLGINDCGTILGYEFESIMDSVFESVHRLYIKAGARNFLFIDVPPIDRTPGAAIVGIDFQERVERWNELLVEQASELASMTEQATVLVFSSHRVLTDILDHPTLYGFTGDDVTEHGGAIWIDNLHLTPAGHEVIAQRVYRALEISPL